MSTTNYKDLTNAELIIILRKRAIDIYTTQSNSLTDTEELLTEIARRLETLTAVLGDIYDGKPR